MTKFLLSLFALLILSSNSWAAILVMSPNGTYTTKTTLSAAATAADAAGKTVVVTSALSASFSNISSATVHEWPADRALKVEKGGSIGNTTAFDFASGASFSAPMAQVFAGSGAVTGLKESNPIWFGADPTGVADSWAAIQKAVTAANGGTVRVPTGIYELSHPFELVNTTMYSDGAFRATPGWTSYTMTDGRVSEALMYIGTGARFTGSQIEGSYIDFDGADRNGVARAGYCIEAGMNGGPQSHNFKVSHVKMGKATKAGIRQHGGGYFSTWEDIHMSALPIGFDATITDESPNGSWGPTTLINVYAVVCKLGFRFQNIALTAISIGTDNCDQGIYLGTTATVNISGWNCEQVMQPILSVEIYSNLKITSSYFSFIGREATPQTNTYSGQTGTLLPLAGLYFASFSNSDISIENVNVYVTNPTGASRAFDYFFAGGSGFGTPGVDDSRVAIRQAYMFYQAAPRQPASTAFGANFYSGYAPTPRDYDVDIVGVYTPTLTNDANVAASTSFQAIYTRIANVVTVNGKINIDPTAATATLIYISLPIASTLATDSDLSGTISALATAETGGIMGSTDKALAYFVAVSVADHEMRYQFSYLVK